MKNNIPDSADRLIIRKDAEKSVVYHYDRAARLALKRSAEKQPEKKGFFRRLSHLRLLLIYLILIILIIIGVGYFFNLDKSSGVIAGYKVQLFAFKVQETLYTFVSFEKATGSEPLMTGNARILFRLRKSGREVTEKLDWQDSGNKEVKITLPVTREDSSVEALITVGEETISLFKNIAG